MRSARLPATAFCLAISMAGPAHASETDWQAWGTANTTGSIRGDLMGNSEVVVRASEGDGRVYQAEMTGQLGYRVNRDLTLWGGYTRIADYDGRPGTRIEHRIRQQVSLRLGKLAGGALASRTLLETRFRENIEGTSLRLRHRFNWTLPLRKDEKLSLAASHESFITLNDVAWQESGFNRMRTFIGLGFPVIEDVRAEVGYMNEYDFEPDAPDEIDHAAAVTVSYAF